MALTQGTNQLDSFPRKQNQQTDSSKIFCQGKSRADTKSFFTHSRIRATHEYSVSTLCGDNPYAIKATHPTGNDFQLLTGRDSGNQNPLWGGEGRGGEGRAVAEEK